MKINYSMSGKWFLYNLTGIITLTFLTMSHAAEKIREGKQVERDKAVTLFLAGDVMTGRGIDQVLPHPLHPRIYEPYVRDAGVYVKLAEDINGPISRPVEWNYLWGIALESLSRLKPDAKIINLETAITKSSEYWRGKGINYRMNPDNIPAITAAGVDVAVLANNHVLDWGYSGLEETLKTLQRAGIGYAGAGMNLDEAEKPALVDLGVKGRVLVFSYALEMSGVPEDWAATDKKGGVNLLGDLSTKRIDRMGKKINQARQKGDLVVVSLHWGENWGYAIKGNERDFAHGLIDKGMADLIHGHSSHHVKGIEVYKGKLILYGCGDLINDYEGIGGYEAFRGGLGLMYFASLDPLTGRLLSLKMIPVTMRNFRLNRVTEKDFQWLVKTLNREGKKLGTRVERHGENELFLRWE